MSDLADSDQADMKDVQPTVCDTHSLVDGFETTLNNMGFAASTIDQYCRKFVEFAPDAAGPILEIGAAFGLTTIAALAKGAQVIANDIDARHLHILSERVPETYRSRLRLLHGSAPNLELEENTLGGILISRVLHFFDGLRIQQMFRNANRWLVPGGKIFLVAETPYQKTVETFIPTYERRKDEGRLWPGFIHDINAYANNRAGSIPNMVHFLDAETLTRELKQIGFIIEEAELFSRPDFPEQYRFDGRESVGIVAIKPSDP